MATSGDHYEVEVDDGAKEEIRRLACDERTRGVAQAALEVALKLRKDPYLGKELRLRYGVGDLSDCRSVLFDEDGWTDKPRYRLVYRNEPEDGAPYVVAVLAVGERLGLAGYKRAVERRGRRNAARDG